MAEAAPAPKPQRRGPSMTRIVDNELLEVDIESGLVRKPAKPYVSPWGPSQKSKNNRRRR